MNQPVVGSITTDHLSGSVRRMIIYNDQIELKRSLLHKHGTNGIFDGSYPVADRDNHSGFIFEASRFKLHGLDSLFQIFFAISQGRSKRSFHFQLNIAVFGIYIIKLLFSAFTVIFFLERIQILSDMNNSLQHTSTIKTKAIQTGIF